MLVGLIFSFETPNSIRIFSLEALGFNQTAFLKGKNISASLEQKYKVIKSHV